MIHTNYKGVSDALISITRTEGFSGLPPLSFPLISPFPSYSHRFSLYLIALWLNAHQKALYKGLSTTLVGAAPYQGLKFGAYEMMKKMASEVLVVEEGVANFVSLFEKYLNCALE